MTPDTQGRVSSLKGSEDGWLLTRRAEPVPAEEVLDQGEVLHAGCRLAVGLHPLVNSVRKW